MLRWLCIFGIANSVVLTLLSVSYLLTLFPLELGGINTLGHMLTLFFITINHLGYWGLIALLACIPLVPIVTLLPQFISKTLCALYSFALLLLLLCDAVSFYKFHFHLNESLINMLTQEGAEQIFQLSRHEVLTLIVCCSLLFALQIAIVRYANKMTPRFTQISGTLKKAGYLLLFCNVLSFLMLIASLQQRHTELFSQTKAYPLYNRYLATLIPMPNAYQQIEQMLFGNFVQLPQTKGQLNYPRHPLQCKASTPPLNVVFIVIDSWRFDMMNNAVTPAIDSFSQQTTRFREHMSGGNATKPGLFSMLYGLPINYWSSMLREHQGPVLFEELLKQHYQIAINASAQISVPEYHQTLFADIHPLATETEGDLPADRDRRITEDALHFLQKRDKTRPFFNFVFYNSAHAWCQTQNFSAHFSPAASICQRLLVNNETDPLPYLNRYKNALYFIDGQVAQILKQLDRDKLLDSTVVIITGDHGQEFNDNKQNYWEHASNYTKYQIQTPLLIHWPQGHNEVVRTRTSHYDVVPTLMTRLLHCDNANEDYSIGKDLFTGTPAKILLAGSYIDYALLQDKQITRMTPSGLWEVQDDQGKVLPKQKPDNRAIKQMLSTLRFYYRANRG